MKRVMLLVVSFLVLGLVGMASAQLPAGWSQADIGSPSPAGSASYDQATGTWTVTSDGADIWETSDSFHFVFRRLKGDGTMTARVVSIAGAGLHEWAKAGVMIRETLNANSRHAMMTMTPSGIQNHAAQFLWRPTTGGFSDQSSGGSMNLPYWVRIVRSGNTFTGYISPNGSTWTPQGTAQTISMSQDVYIGLAAVSRVAGQLLTAKFDNVAIQGELIEEVPAKAITYQGRLLDGDLAADGLYDLQFSLYDAQTGGSQKGQTVAIEDRDVIEGYFTVELNFGEGVFDGNPRWLQIAVRPGASTGNLTILDPRQRIAPTPYALYAFSGAGGSGDVTAPLVLSGSVAGSSGAIIKGTNTGSGIGLYGQGLLAGVYGDNSSSGNVGMLGGPIWGVYGSSMSGLAGLFDGTVQITGGSPGAGKVLTSDASGLASWQTPTGGGGGPDSDWTISGDNMYSGVSGNIGIGTESPSYKLDVQGDIRARGTVFANCLAHFVNPEYFVAPTYSRSINVIGDIITTGGKVCIGTTGPGGYALYVNGYAYSTGGWTTSDARFKKDVRQIDSALDKVMDLHGVSFEWDSSSNPDKQFPQGRHYGVIAQEVEQVVPEVVMEGAQGEKAVSYTELVPILIEAVKELNTRNQDLRTDNAELRDRVSDLTARLERMEAMMRQISNKSLERVQR